MKFIGNIIDSMKSDNGEEFEAYEAYGVDLDDDDDDEDDEPVKKTGSFFRKKKAKEFDYELDEPKSEQKASKMASKITPITRKRSGGNSPEVHGIKPASFEEAR